MKRRSRSLDLGAIALLVFSMVFVSAVGLRTEHEFRRDPRHGYGPLRRHRLRG